MAAARRQEMAAPSWELKRLLYSRAETARLLSLRVETVEGLVEDGELKVINIGPRQERITASSILSYLNRAPRGRGVHRSKGGRILTRGSWRGK